MISRQFAAPLAASLLGMVVCAGAYGQSEYQNQPAGRNPGAYYVPSVPSNAPSSYVQPSAEYQNQPAGRNPGAYFVPSVSPSGPSAYVPSTGEYQNQPAGRNPGAYYVPSVPSYAPSYYVQPAPVVVGQQPAGTPDTGFASADVLNNDSALLKVHLPADAKLYFGTTEAALQSGSMRLFRSPSLDRGSNYQYDLRARWTENGRTVERTRSVPIHANDVVNVDFTHGG
jgi:uncharacterized protein (TIGR03000 family)